MPETTANTENSCNEWQARNIARQDALKLRDMVGAGASGDDIEGCACHMLEGVVYSIVSVALEEPL